ncbi:MAG: hypothetical protein ACRC9Q_01160 [Bacteroidales bacterium]
MKGFILRFLFLFVFCFSHTYRGYGQTVPAPKTLEDRFFEITKFEKLEPVIKNNIIDVSIDMGFNGKVFPLHVVTNGMESFRGETNLFGFKFHFLRDQDIIWMKVLGFWKKNKIPHEDNNPILNFAEWKNKKLQSRTIGDSVMSGSPVWVVHYHAHNETHQMYVAKNSGLVLQVNSQYKDAKTQVTSDYMLQFSDYRMFQDVYAPHRMAVTDVKKNRVFTMQIKSAVLKNSIPKSYFQSPR